MAGLQVSGGFDEVLIVWDVRNARPVKIIPGHCDPVTGGALGGWGLCVCVCVFGVVVGRVGSGGGAAAAATVMPEPQATSEQLDAVSVLCQKM